MDDFPEYELRIYGEESDSGVKGELLMFINQNNMQERVKLMGQSARLEKEISDASLFVLSSDYEGMPNALIEAMAMGIPVISTDCPCGGPRELIQNEESGLLVSVGSKKEMETAMRKMLGDQNFAKCVGKKGKEIKERVSPAQIYLEWKIFVEEKIGMYGENNERI